MGAIAAGQPMPPISLITNYLPPYRVPLYRLLHERYGVEVHCFGGEGGYVADAGRDLERQLAEAPFPAHRLARQGDAGRVAGESEAAIVAVTGRVAVPSAWYGARQAHRPFLLWASLWRHPLTLAHMGSLPSCGASTRKPTRCSPTANTCRGTSGATERPIA